MLARRYGLLGRDGGGQPGRGGRVGRGGRQVRHGRGEGVQLEILSAEDLVVFKVLFDRPKDWTDLDEVLYAQGPAFDAAYALDWLRRILEAEDSRLLRFVAALEKEPSGP